MLLRASNNSDDFEFFILSISESYEGYKIFTGAFFPPEQTR